MFFEKALYDNTATNNFIESWFYNRTVVRHLEIGVTNLLTGQFVTFSEEESNENMIKVLQASITFAGLTPAI